MEQSRIIESAFGALLRHHRLAAGLSQEMLAEQARMSADGIGALERGHRRFPHRETVVLLAKALNLPRETAMELEAAAARPRSPRASRATVTVERSSDDTNLPCHQTSLIGRDGETAEIVDMLQTCRLVTITGSGGVGKTRTALSVGETLRRSKKSQICFVELAPIAQGSRVATTVASALHVHESAGGSAVEAVQACLQHEDIVLVLDNCEHVIRDVAALADTLLRGCPQLRILATSRESLRISGESAYRLPSLGVPTPAEIDGLTARAAETYDAISLFVQRAQAVDRRFLLSDENAPTVADICRRLDGIPLAIELAASRITILQPHEMRTRLNERFRFLSGGRRDSLPRHQTMHALIDWSYDLLGDEERRLFRRLGIFVNSFTLDGATAVGGDGSSDDLVVFELLASLVDKSLVVAEATNDSTRYRLLETTRAYAIEKLDAEQERETHAERHLCHIRDVFVDAGEAFDAEPRWSIMHALVFELDDARAAVKWAAVNGRIALGADILCATHVWSRFSNFVEAYELLRQYSRLCESQEVGIQARIWANFANICPHVGHNGIDAARTALALGRASNEPKALMLALMAWSNIMCQLGNYAESLAALDEVELLATNLPYVRLMATRLRAVISEYLGDLETAARLYDEVAKTNRSLGNDDAIDLLNRAELAHVRGDTEQAIVMARDALRPGRPRMTAAGRATLQSNLMGYLVANGALEEIRDLGRDLLAARAGTASEDAIVFAMEHVALAAALRGDLRSAARLKAYVERRLRELSANRSSTELATYKALSSILEERFTASELKMLFSEGASWTRAVAVSKALDVLARHDVPSPELTLRSDA